jgi:tetratricopeptide (TPR) repeat protein
VIFEAYMGRYRAFIDGLLLMAAWPAGLPQAQSGIGPATIVIDYPLNDSIFPPSFAAPTWNWRDSSPRGVEWRILVSFGDGTPGLEIRTRGGRLQIGEIDPRCVGETNEAPRLTPEQKAAHTWTPDAKVWESIQRHSVERPARVAIEGFDGNDPNRAVSRGEFTIRTSADPLNAPIFYRDVPLLPSETEKGTIKPLAPRALPLIQWKLRDIAEPSSRVLMRGLHTCANCHSFSRDGKTLGLDLDGPQNDKGLYALAAVGPRMSIRNEDVISWEAFRPGAGLDTRVGFMSQVSPDGRYVVTTVNVAFYSANFKDYRFLQVFYPTRGILAFYDRVTRRMQPLPGADDPRYVHTNAVWSPDGSYLVFARAKAVDPYTEGAKPAAYANDPAETQIRYDLYRIPFNAGKGGHAEPVTGASQNGRSNSFPKISPDGRWIVFVEARNGLLMRPDSQLYIVPAQGGQARRMRCNTALMNSWHSFSPDGRWLVFSSKSQSPYTQMFLTHLDVNGVDTSPVRIENATAANRAVNIPEFVNLPKERLLNIDVPAAEFYRLYDSAWDLTSQGRDADAIAEWRKAVEANPNDARARNNLGGVLLRMGFAEEAVQHLQKAVELNPRSANAHNNLALALSRTGRFDDALPHWQKAIEIDPGFVEAWFNLGGAFYERRRIREAIGQWRHALALNPNHAEVLRLMSWVLATCPEPGVRDGREAVALGERAVQASGGRVAVSLDALAAAYAEAGRFADALRTARRSLGIAQESSARQLVEDLRRRIELYEKNLPYREQ